MTWLAFVPQNRSWQPIDLRSELAIDVRQLAETHHFFSDDVEIRR